MTLEKDIKLLADLKASKEDLELRIKELQEKIKKEVNKFGDPFETTPTYIPWYPTFPMYPSTTPKTYDKVWCSINTTATNAAPTFSGYITYNY